MAHLDPTNETDDTFREFVRTAFQSDHEEAVLEAWPESNPDGVVEDLKSLLLDGEGQVGVAAKSPSP